MDKKVYYGEYTLFHWIELILKHNIVLPDYQRGYVWPKSMVERFISTLDESFVPPIIIGAFKNESKRINLILDGQQRLTSILLAYLGLYPKEGAFKKRLEPMYQDSGEVVSEEDIEEEVIEWSFKMLLHEHELRLTKEMVLRYVNMDQYEVLEHTLDESFLRSHYLGFSYIVPGSDMEVEQQKFYSTVFRNINQQGITLQGQESRRALYYLNADLVKFFEPDCFNPIRVMQNGKNMRYDFVRSMAFLSQYAYQNKETNIAQRCYRQEQLEQLYEDYIIDVVEDRESTRFGKFSILIGKENLQTRFAELERCIRFMELARNYPSIIDADLFLFGLIYHTIIKGQTIDMDRREEIKSNVSIKAMELKGDDSHKRTPNKISHLRKRIKESILLYNEFVNVSI